MSIFLTKRFYIVALCMIALLLIGNTIHFVFLLTKWLIAAWALCVLIDFLLLYFIRSSKMQAERICAERFSNGDENDVKIKFNNPYFFKSKVEIIDEMPIDFQMREFVLSAKLEPKEEREIVYKLIPKKRGEYKFDHIRLFFSTPLGLVQRRFTRGTAFDVKVYPSFSKLSLYSLMANHHHLDEYGIKQIRQVGADTEFDQIKDYVQGDEYRHINWKASARTNSLKVNVYQQERSIQVFSVIDKGRMMQQSAYGLTFFEYAINAALAVSYVSIKKEDKAGLASFDKDMDNFVPASRLGSHMQNMMEALYHEQTIFEESDYSALASGFLKRCTKHSLVILYCNFSTLNALQRELPYLRQISKKHKLIVVVFKDRQMQEYLESKARNTEDYYQHMMVEKYMKEKDLIISTLRQNGILTIYTLPENLSVNVINKYLEVRRF